MSLQWSLLLTFVQVTLSCTLLQPGVNHLWTTPILRRQLIDDPNSLSMVTDAILRRFRALSSSEGSDPGGYDGWDDETPNDRFFNVQRQSWEKGEPFFLQTSASEAECEAYRCLRAAWLAEAHAYVSEAASASVADALFEGGPPRLFVWASVHEGSSAHERHDHECSAVSGVFYVAAPLGSGRIRFEDPRVARLYWGSSQFEHTELAHSPSNGELLLFPPWLVHSVDSSDGAMGPRISISFNLYSAGEGRAAADRQALAVSKGSERSRLPPNL